ncbi:MAG: hypothetical protein ACMUHB_02410 [Thermoplasmatota archaeon]
MRKILILGVLAILITMAVANVVMADDKEIHSDQFSVGDEESYINITSPTLTIGDDLYNDEAKIMIFNNATYSGISFDISAGADTEGNYPSDVILDLGDNGRAEYRFGGYGTGDWGNQYYLMTEDRSAGTTGSAYPSVDGDIYYLKLPSNAVVSSAEVNLTHPAGTVSKTVSIPSSNNWARSYMYYYNYYPYGYGYFYPSSNAGTYAQSNDYVAPTDYRYGSGYPMGNAYLSWNIDSDDFMVPYGADITSYELSWPIRHYRYSGSFPGYSGSYHHGEMTWKVYPVLETWPSSYQRSNTVYYSKTDIYNEFKRINPDWQSTPVAEYTAPAYHGYSSSYYYNTNVKYDLIDLVKDWNDETLDNFGIMVAMAETPVDSDIPQWDGYSYYSSRTNYYRFY